MNFSHAVATFLLLCFVSSFHSFFFLFFILPPLFFRVSKCYFMNTHTGGKYRSICYGRTLFQTAHKREKTWSPCFLFQINFSNKFFEIFLNRGTAFFFFQNRQGERRLFFFNRFEWKHPQVRKRVEVTTTVGISIGRIYYQASRICVLKIVSELVRCSLKLQRQGNFN